MESGDTNTVSISSHFTLVQLITAFITVVVPIAGGALYFMQWSVEHTVAGIHREIENNDVSAKEKIASLETKLQVLQKGLDSSQNRIDIDKVSTAAVKNDVGNVKNDVGNVKNEVIEVKDDVVDVRTDVIEVRAKVNEMSSDINDTSHRIKLVRSVLGNAFKDNPEILLQLTDDRLSENLPLEFFGNEPRAGAALPLTQDTETIIADPVNSSSESPLKPGALRGSASGLAKGTARGIDTAVSGSNTIADHCQEREGATYNCYLLYLEQYEKMRIGERNDTPD